MTGEARIAGLGRFRRAVVTGGAGFIGSHIVDALVQEGIDTSVLDDLSSGSRDNLPSVARVIEVDISNPSVMAIISRIRPDLVIHAAAQVSVSASVRDAGRDRDVNLVGTEHVVQGARAAGRPRLVFISSGGAIYGPASAATEDTVPAPQNPYGIHKLAAEGYVRLSGLPYGVVRFSNVYGPRQRPDLEGGVVARFVGAMKSDRRVVIYGDGHQSRDFLFVLDAVSGLLAVAAATVDGTWNVSTGLTTSVNELLRSIEAAAGRTCHVTHAPLPPGDIPISGISSERIRLDLGWTTSFTVDAGLRACMSSEDLIDVVTAERDAIARR